MKTFFYTWPMSTLWALWNVILSLFKLRKFSDNYFINLGYYIDLLGNALTGGNPEVTVSARVGYYSKYYKIRYENYTGKDKYQLKRNKLYVLYWKTCESIIDKTFEPVDGKNHCYNAYLNTKKNLKNINGKVPIQRGSFFFFTLLLPIIALVCLILTPIILIISKK